MYKHGHGGPGVHYRHLYTYITVIGRLYKETKIIKKLKIKKEVGIDYICIKSKETRQKSKSRQEIYYFWEAYLACLSIKAKRIFFILKGSKSILLV